MTSHEIIPIPPPMIGEVLADPSAYQAWALQLPGPASAPRARQPRRARRAGRARKILRAALLAAVGLPLAGCALTSHSAPAHAQRPVWDGRGTYSSGTEPLCPAQLAGRTAQAGSPGHRFTVTCEWDGTEYAWNVVTGGAR